MLITSLSPSGASRPRYLAAAQEPPKSPDSVKLGDSEAAAEKKISKFGKAAKDDWDPAALKANLGKEIDKMFTFLRTLEPALSVYGSSRELQPGSHEEEVCHFIGHQAAELGLAIHTGGGGGAMETPLVAYREARGPNTQQNGKDLRTQAINVKLPWEQKLNPEVEVSHEVGESLGLLYRELGIYLNSVGTAVVAGGIGTVNELFDLWDRGLQGRHSDPMMVDATYWGPLLGAIKDSGEPRGLITDKEWSTLELSRDRQATKEAFQQADLKGWDVDSHALQERLKTQLAQGIDKLSGSGPAVTFIGSDRLQASDPACATAENMAELLAKEGETVRMGCSGPLAEAITRGARSGSDEADLQAFVMKSEQDQAGEHPVAEHFAVDDPTTKQMLLALRSKAVVALPGDVRSLADTLSVLVLAYVNAIPKVPIVLVGEKYWKPILMELQKTMLKADFSTASQSILERVTITDDPQWAAAKIQAGVRQQ